MLRKHKELADYRGILDLPKDTDLEYRKRCFRIFYKDNPVVAFSILLEIDVEDNPEAQALLEKEKIFQTAVDRFKNYNMGEVMYFINYYTEEKLAEAISQPLQEFKQKQQDEMRKRQSVNN